MTSPKFFRISAAAARIVWDLLGPESRRAIEFLERFVDDGADLAEMIDAALGSVAFARARRDNFAAESVARAVSPILFQAGGLDDALDYLDNSWSDGGFCFAMIDAVNFAVKARAHADRLNVATVRPRFQIVMNDISPEDRPPPINPDWLKADVLDLALSTARTGEFDAMPILGDALEEAGCEVPEVLDHCRGTLGHVRGCWVVEAILDVAVRNGDARRVGGRRYR